MARTIPEMYSSVRLWTPHKEFIPPQNILPAGHPQYALFLQAYTLSKELAAKAPPRKNGEHWFIHPLNVALTLQRARISDPLPFCSAMLHDYIEDQVDFYQVEQDITKEEQGLQILHRFQQECFLKLENSLKAHGHPEAKTILTVIDLLTRAKENYYLYSISGIFDYPKKKLKEMAIQVKLADRMHNIQSIENFNEQQRLYECFKNLFILNNAKQFILDTYGKEKFYAYPSVPTIKLFSQCCKATYEAFARICLRAEVKGIAPIQTMLQLAFKKFQFEIGGLWEVTKVNNDEQHPLRLYQGIVRKYEARLHQEWEKLAAIKGGEFSYCQAFFSVFHFTPEQIWAILDYKDAYALKEVVAELLYDREYVVSGFLTKELLKGRIKG